MKKLSQRVASLTSSITVGLILFAVGLTALLAYRALEASRAQRQLSEQTLREYAGFAAFQLKNASINQLMGRPRAAFELVVRAINTTGPTPPLGAKRVAELVAPMDSICRCLYAVSFYYQVTFADSGVEATPSPLATADNLKQLRDAVVAHTLAPRQPEPVFQNNAGPRPPGVPVTTQQLASILAHVGKEQFILTHALTADANGRPLVAYGYASPAARMLDRTVMLVLRNQSVLPVTLTRGLRMDSILDVTVRSPMHETIYQSNPSAPALYASTDSSESRLGPLQFEVAINPAAAGRLIIGGLPESRLPEVLATAFVAVGLLGLLFYQFRRQEELSRLRDDFVSGVSHELRTPLAQIRLLAELLYMGKVPGEERERSLRIIDKEARRLSFLVDSILSFTHTRREQLAPVNTDVATEIDEIVAGFKPLAQAEGVRLDTHIERGIDATVDRGALRQVLLNLLDNAVRYGPPRQTVTITTASAGDRWKLEVVDEGPGIPAGERERVFAPYYRMKRDAGGAVGGTGIGLAVVRRLVEEHGGRVYVADANGSGTGARFIVEMPVDVQGVNG